jgi:hypothetical protein
MPQSARRSVNGKRSIRRPTKHSSREVIPRPVGEAQARTSENLSALRLVRALRGPNNKYINSSQSAIGGTVTASSPYLFLLNGVQQGTTENTRIGRLTRNRWLDIDMSMYAGSGFNSTSVCRIYVVAETTALGSALAPAQFFVDNSTWTPFSQRDRTNRNASRYVVLWDSKPFSLGGLGLSTGGTTTYTAPVGVVAAEKPFSFHLPLDFQTDYSRGNAGTIADIDSNSLYLMAVCDDSTSSQIFIGGGYTLCFSDDS